MAASSSLGQAGGASPALLVQGRFLPVQGLAGATHALCTTTTTISSGEPFLSPFLLLPRVLNRCLSLESYART